MSLLAAIHWSEDETKEAISGLLPQGWEFDCKLTDAGWEGVFQDDTGAVQWQEQAFAPNLLLLNAYGWLYKRTLPGTAASSVWSPHRKDLTTEVVGKAAAQLTIPDPEDLDPEELELVYGLRETDPNDDPERGV